MDPVGRSPLSSPSVSPGRSLTGPVTSNVPSAHPKDATSREEATRAIVNPAFLRRLSVISASPVDAYSVMVEHEANDEHPSRTPRRVDQGFRGGLYR